MLSSSDGSSSTIKSFISRNYAVNLSKYCRRRVQEIILQAAKEAPRGPAVHRSGELGTVTDVQPGDAVKDQLHGGRQVRIGRPFVQGCSAQELAHQVQVGLLVSFVMPGQQQDAGARRVV